MSIFCHYKVLKYVAMGEFQVSANIFTYLVVHQQQKQVDMSPVHLVHIKFMF